MKTTMKIFKTRQHIEWLCQCMPLITSRVPFCDFPKWLLIVGMKFFIFILKEPFTPIWHTRTPGNKQMSICFNSCIYSWGNNQQDIWKTWQYDHIKDTCIWDRWVLISGQDACFTLTGQHDREYHPNITHIWVYTGTEPLPY